MLLPAALGKYRGLMKSRKTEDCPVPEKMHGSKSVQVKGVMLLWQPNPGKHRPAKPCGKDGLNNIFTDRGISYAII
ncbi:hypothetical protein DXA36_20200 [Eisenbergiella sp. OF01-20]|nr:hypothetical protein DXA36_20200 [Eisenbergiella sp. OF01-20]